MEHHDDTLGRAELCDRVCDRPAAEVVLGRLTERPRVEGALLVVDDLQPPTPTEGIDCCVDRDPLEPGRERLCLVEAIERSERLHERLLPCVVGKATIGGDCVGRAPGEDPVAIEERARCLGRAFAGEHDELGVGAAAHSCL